MSKGAPTPPASGPAATTACSDPVAPCPLGNLIVHVRRDSASGPIIAGATVSIAGPESAAGTSDATDKAEFKKIKPGTYTVSASKSGYTPEPKTDNATVPTSGTTEVTLVLNCKVDDYEKDIVVNSYGRYFKKYKADGTELSYNFQKKYKIKVPLKTGNQITVEVRFKVEVQSGVTEADATTAKSNLESGITTHWNGKFTLEAEDPECGKKSFSVVYKPIWVDSGGDYTMKIHATYPREGLSGSTLNVSKTTGAWTHAHEFGHCVGLPDEYSYSTETESVKYIKPDGSLDSPVSAPPDGKPTADPSATIMAAVNNTTVLPRHGWNIAIEVQELLSAKLGRNIKCTIK